MKINHCIGLFLITTVSIAQNLSDLDKMNLKGNVKDIYEMERSKDYDDISYYSNKYKKFNLEGFISRNGFWVNTIKKEDRKINAGEFNLNLKNKIEDSIIIIQKGKFKGKVQKKELIEYNIKNQLISHSIYEAIIDTIDICYGLTKTDYEYRLKMMNQYKYKYDDQDRITEKEVYTYDDSENEQQFKKYIYNYELSKNAIIESIYGGFISDKFDENIISVNFGLNKPYDDINHYSNYELYNRYFNDFFKDDSLVVKKDNNGKIILRESFFKNKEYKNKFSSKELYEYYDNGNIKTSEVAYATLDTIDKYDGEINLERKITEETLTLYDLNGNQIRKMLFDYDYYSVMVKYEYKYDKQNNWIQRKKYRKGELVETTLRKINYY